MKIIMTVHTDLIQWLQSDFDRRVVQGESKGEKKVGTTVVDFRQATVLSAHELLSNRYGEENVTLNPDHGSKAGGGWTFDVKGVRVHASGCRWKEIVDFNAGGPALEASDQWMLIDFSGLIEGRVGQYEHTPEFARTGELSFWLVPTDLIRELALSGIYGRVRARLQLVRPGSKRSVRKQPEVLRSAQNNWNSLDNAIKHAPKPKQAPQGDFVDTIVQARKAKGITQTALALEVGFDNPNFVSMIEGRKSRLPHDRVVAYATTLDLDPHALKRLWMSEYMPSFADAI